MIKQNAIVVLYYKIQAEELQQYIGPQDTKHRGQNSAQDLQKLQSEAVTRKLHLFPISLPQCSHRQKQQGHICGQISTKILAMIKVLHIKSGIFYPVSW